MSATTHNAKRTRVDERLRAEVSRAGSRLKKQINLLDDDDPGLPALPPADASGHYPALETARAIVARQVIRARKAAGWTQAELAARAGVRPTTIRRIETGKHSSGLKTMAKVDRALKRAGV